MPKTLKYHGTVELDHLPGQLNFSSSDFERKLKEFPPGSGGGPSGSHLKEMLKTRYKQSFLSALAAFLHANRQRLIFR